MHYLNASARDPFVKKFLSISKKLRTFAIDFKSFLRIESCLLEAFCFLVLENLGNFQADNQGCTTASRVYAWAVFTFDYRVFPRTFKYNVRQSGPRFLLFIRL